MTALPKQRMTLDEFLAWSDATPGRFELLHGHVYEMQSERTGHAQVKFRVQAALDNAIRRTGLDCHMLPDGVLVPVDTESGFEPDALVY